MDQNTVYAVVDLETTGTNVQEGDRVIQFSCVLVSNHKIINEFSTFINPDRAIPQTIQSLTGISNNRVKKAPYFDDVAQVIFSMLSDTVFVAHNVNFDFPFINAELERVGYPELAIQAIDTVSLSQILLPTEPSYRLQDLSELLGIEHDHPHEADSDANATAILLLKLLKRLEELPLTTLKTLSELSVGLPMDTGLIFQSAYQNRESHAAPLPADLYIKAGLALHKKDGLLMQSIANPPAYPKNKRSKMKLFGSHLEWRPEQGKMMNMIYQNYSDLDFHDEKSMVIEAPTGIGKSLGYLFPMAYLSQQGQVVISTATTVLQEQLLTQTVETLNHILPFEVTAVILKGQAHYLDLARFAASLTKTGESKQTQLFKQRLLVWLTETRTGDLDELHLTNYNAPYFQSIEHHGIQSLNEGSQFYADDFLVWRDRRMQQANFVITNHAYLSSHASELGSETKPPLLVVDEAQHLPESTLNQRRTSLSITQMLSSIHHLRTLIANEHAKNLQEVFDADGLSRFELGEFEGTLTSMEQGLNRLNRHLFETFVQVHKKSETENAVEELLDQEKLAAFFNQRQPLLDQLAKWQADLLIHTGRLAERFGSQRSQWLASDQSLFESFEHYGTELDDQLNQLAQFSQSTQEHDQLIRLFWLTIRQDGDRNTMRLSGGLLTTKNYLSDHIYRFFRPAVFTGATLLSSSRSSYLSDQFDLNPANTEYKRLKSTFDYEKQAALFIANDTPDMRSTNQHDYAKYLADAILTLSKDLNKQTLILFNSLQMISRVYDHLMADDDMRARDILAQGVTGSRERILKRFAAGDHSILLGASSFWEGVDLPADHLEYLIIAQLPFDAPEQVFTKAEAHYLRANNKNPFTHAVLPKAVLRLRQGVGRLIRTDHDTGAIVILDSRIETRKYGHSMQHALPQSLPKTIATVNVLSDGVHDFFKQHSQPPKGVEKSHDA